MTGFIILWNNNVISWKSKKQTTISLSSTEAEYKAIGDTTKEIMWIKIVLNKILNIRLKEPTVVHEDNQGAIQLALNEANHNNFKTKHMNIRFHFIRNEIRLQNIKLEYVRTILNLADFLTKPVGKTSLSPRKIRHILSSRDIMSLWWENSVLLISNKHINEKKGCPHNIL